MSASKNGEPSIFQMAQKIELLTFFGIMNRDDKNNNKENDSDNVQNEQWKNKKDISNKDNENN